MSSPSTHLGVPPRAPRAEAPHEGGQAVARSGIWALVVDHWRWAVGAGIAAVLVVAYLLSFRPFLLRSAPTGSIVMVSERRIPSSGVSPLEIWTLHGVTLDGGAPVVLGFYLNALPGLYDRDLVSATAFDGQDVFLRTPRGRFYRLALATAACERLPLTAAADSGLARWGFCAAGGAVILEGLSLDGPASLTRHQASGVHTIADLEFPRILACRGTTLYVAEGDYDARQRLVSVDLDTGAVSERFGCAVGPDCFFYAAAGDGMSALLAEDNQEFLAIGSRRVALPHYRDPDVRYFLGDRYVYEYRWHEGSLDVLDKAQLQSVARLPAPQGLRHVFEFGDPGPGQR